MKNVKLCIFCGICAFLTACGSSNENRISMKNNSPLESILAEAQSQNVAGIVSELSKSSSYKPTFGSVTQSTDNGAGAKVIFDGASTSIVVNKSDGSSIRFGGSAVDSDQKVVKYENVEAPPAFWTKGHSMNSTEITGQKIHFSSVETSWDQSDPNSYVTFGFWEEYRRDSDQYHAESFGAFVDGPELMDGFSWGNSSGTATYEGMASGIYAYHVPDNSDSGEVGVFQAALTLHLNLDDRTIRGDAGRDTGVEVFRSGEDDPVILPIAAMLKETKIDNYGSFSSNEFEIMSAQLPLTGSSGYWGGKLSSKSNDENKPRMVAGTAAGTWTDIMGGKGSLNSAWIAAADDTRGSNR